jgi:DNA-binding NtrC family response regulator
VIVASNANLDQLSEARLFRKDLLYRINVLSVRLPALRERGDDVLELARIFLRDLSEQYDRPKAHFSLSSLAFMRQHPWPGLAAMCRLSAAALAGSRADPTTRTAVHLIGDLAARVQNSLVQLRR